MSEQHEQTVRCYATEKLSEARSTILQQSHQMLILRAKVEKYRQNDLHRAQGFYLELQKTQRRILTALTDAQLSLMEAEEYALAAKARALHKGLAGFELMSMAYKPVYEALSNFAKELPAHSDTVNAAVIGRLMNQVRMGYYPTDPENISHILHGIQFPTGVTTNVFDPCCGCGKALRQIATGNNCYTYGVELDEYRVEEAQRRLHRVGVGSFFHSRISNEAFHVLFLNPPYLSVLSEGGSRTRHEKRFLIESIPHLVMGGLMIYIIPYYRLTEDICRILADNFSNLSVWRFTDNEFSRFKQVAILGNRKKRAEDMQTASALSRLSCNPQRIPVITQLEENRYAVPSTPKKVDVFKGECFNVKELEQQLSRSDSFKRMMNAASELDNKEKHPLLPLSIGQIGLVGGSGMINGLIDCPTPHIIKGRIIKVKNETREEIYSPSGLHLGAEVKEVISNKMVFNVLTPTGFKALT